MRPSPGMPYTLAMQHGRCNAVDQMLSSELVRSVLDSAPDAMIIIDSAGTIVFANTQVSALFGYPAAEILGAPIEVLMPQRFRARHIAHRAGYGQNVRVRPMGMGLDLFGIRKDGSEFPVEISLSPIQQGEEMLVAAAIRDVSERKRVQVALEEARREAERADKAKTRFLATASHDLRQPLQTLGLLNGALRRMIQDGECLDLLHEQDQAIDAMSRLLNALLDISKLESGVVKPERRVFEISPLFDELRREFTNLAANKGLRLSIDAPRAFVHSDPALVSQVLRNLLSNAIKYTLRGSVELRCEARDQALRIEVRDTGVGIPAEQLGLIFDEFYQIGISPNSSREGYGLGLSIVQRIARVLGIEVSVFSQPGIGSVFAIELPSAVAPEISARARTPEVAHRANSDSRHILLVEDEPGVRNALRTLLKVEGYQVTSAASAEEALVELDNEPDLLVTDYHLEEGRTGKQVIAAARERFGAGFRAILISGDTSAVVREIQGDANLRIASKPINSDELLAQVSALLGNT